MPSIVSDQDLRPRTARNICLETTPPAAAAAGLLTGAVVSGQWWIGVLALLPTTAAGWHACRTITNERRYARSCRRVAAARDQRRRDTELEQTAASLIPAHQVQEGQQA